MGKIIVNNKNNKRWDSAVKIMRKCQQWMSCKTTTLLLI